jgi:hypothetical protein
VYRVYLLRVAVAGAAAAAAAAADAHRVFDDRRAPGDRRPLDTTSVPSLDAVTDFYRAVFLWSQMGADCIISLIYVERLLRATSGALVPRPRNWRSLLYACLVLASKVSDDLSMWKGDFFKIGPGGVTFSLPHTNTLEVALLGALGYRVKVGEGEYAKYYFLLWGMLCRSGLGDGPAGPRDAEGTRRGGGRGGGRGAGATGARRP